MTLSVMSSNVMLDLNSKVKEGHERASWEIICFHHDKVIRFEGIHTIKIVKLLEVIKIFPRHFLRLPAMKVFLKIKVENFAQFLKSNNYFSQNMYQVFHH